MNPEKEAIDKIDEQIQSIMNAGVSSQDINESTSGSSFDTKRVHHVQELQKKSFSSTGEVTKEMTTISTEKSMSDVSSSFSKHSLFFFLLFVLVLLFCFLIYVFFK